MNLGVESKNLVVDRRKERRAKACKVTVHFLNKRIGLGRSGHERVALGQGCVVGRNLRRNVERLHTRRNGQSLVGVGGIGEVVAYVAGHVQLVVKILDACLGFLGLRHVHGSDCAYVGNKVFGFVIGNIGIDVAKFRLDYSESVVDKHRCRHGNLVLILHPVLIIYIDYVVEDVVGTLGGYIAIGNVDD